MRSAVRSSFEFLSMSTLDLFASILGTFVLITFVLLPYYLEQPFLEQDIAQAQAETSALTAELRLYREKLTATRTARSEAEDALVAAQQRLAAAKALAAAQPAPKDEAKPAPSPLPTPFSINDLDLVFVMDTTGSMRNELADVQANLLGVIRVLARLAPSLRVGFVAFKDRGDAYVTLTFPLSPMTQGNVGPGGRVRRPDVGRRRRRRSRAGRRGADGSRPRCPGAADAQGRILVVGDAPARPSGRGRALELADQFRSSSSDPARPRTVSAIFTGETAGARLFYEQIARAGGGDFSAYQGQIIENVLLSVLSDPDPAAFGSGGMTVLIDRAGRLRRWPPSGPRGRPMKRVDRTIVLLTLSALDTLATAIGVFVLLVALLMPYYQNSFDLEATVTRICAWRTSRTPRSSSRSRTRSPRRAPRPPLP